MVRHIVVLFSFHDRDTFALETIELKGQESHPQPSHRTMPMYLDTEMRRYIFSLDIQPKRCLVGTVKFMHE